MKAIVINELKNYLKIKLKGIKYAIVGSVGRGVSHPKDLDVVCLYSGPIKEFKDLLKRIFFLDKITGTKRISIKVKILNEIIKIDFWIAKNQYSYLFKKFAYSASKNYTIATRAQAKRLKMKLTDEGLYDSNGKMIPVKTEKQLYKILGRTYKSIKNRV
jgi:DNA polymerase/3'-5' exonuclease PolX